MAILNDSHALFLYIGKIGKKPEIPEPKAFTRQCAYSMRVDVKNRIKAMRLLNERNDTNYGYAEQRNQEDT